MTNHVIPPASVKTLEDQLADSTWVVYLVVGQADDSRGWRRAKTELGAQARTDLVLATDPADVSTYTGVAGVSAWPENAVWAGGTPVAICFGYSGTPQFYLTKEQAEHRETIVAANRRASEKTNKGATS